jgi:MFS family permease
MLAVGANSTAITAALPSMRTDRVLSPEGVQWAVNAYLSPPRPASFCGQAADRFGARLTSLVGLTLFGIASSIIAAAGTQACTLQGLAAAFADGSPIAHEGFRDALNYRCR